MTDVEHAEDTRRAIDEQLARIKQEPAQPTPTAPFPIPAPAREGLERMMRAELDPDDAVTAAGIALDWLTDLADDRVLAEVGLVDTPPGPDPETQPDLLPCWMIAEFHGYVRRSAWVSEVVLAGQSLLRLDVPCNAGGTVVELWSPSAVHRLRPCDEAMARRVAGADPPQPALTGRLDTFNRAVDFDDSVGDGGPC